MALLKTTDDIQKYVNVASDLTFDGVLPDINEVEENIIVKHIGSAFYVEIEAAYQATPTTPQQLVIDRLQECVSNLAIAQYIDTGQIDISNSGLANLSKEKAAFKYQVTEAKNEMLRKGWLALENLLTFLEVTKDTYPTWRDSEEYTVNKELIINSADVFEKYYAIGRSRLLYQQLRYIMKQVEDFELEAVIGSDLLDELKAEILAAGVSGDNQVLLDKFIYAGVANLTIVRALGDMVVKLDSNGAVMHQKLAAAGSGEEDVAAELERVAAKRFNVQRTGYQYFDKLRNYLNANASASKYAAFFDSELYVAPVVDDDEEYESNVYVG